MKKPASAIPALGITSGRSYGALLLCQIVTKQDEEEQD
jgi:hypothetical protein